MAEGVEFSRTNFKYEHFDDYFGGYLSFSSTNNNTGQFIEEMEIEKWFKEKTSNFTIEIYSKYEKNYKPEFDHFCKDNSSEALRGLIRHCRARTLIREMTAEEQEQMRALKEEVKSKYCFSFLDSQ